MTDAHPGAVMARLAEPAAPRTRLAVVADPHVATRAEGTSKLFEHTRDHFAAAVRDAATRDVDAVLSPGDLTKDGEPWNYDAVDDALTALDAPFYAVPGNHDVPKAGDDHDTPDLAAFVDRYTPGALPYHVRVGGVDVIGVNTAGSRDRLRESHAGEVAADTLDWLRDTLATAATPVVVAHHNFPPVTDQLAAHQAIEPGLRVVPGLQNHDPVADVLAAGDVPLVLTGHYHLPTTATYRGVRELAAPTTCSYPQGYLLLDVTPDGTTVRFVPVADDEGLERAHARRAGDSATARGLTSIAAARVASFPLVDDH